MMTKTSKTKKINSSKNNEFGKPIIVFMNNIFRYSKCQKQEHRNRCSKRAASTVFYKETGEIE